MDLYLRKVKHPQARDNYRVIAIVDEQEVEIGSIGVKVFTSSDVTWTWGIDAPIQMRAFETEGRGKDRQDCLLKFRAAWDRFAEDHARLTEFMNAKRRARR